ncbi:PmrA [Streptomyces sp. NWU339]|nr:PmrA [Streptomyces sp. NWU339]
MEGAGPACLAARYSSAPSLGRYAHPCVDAVAAHVAASDPVARRRG